MIHLRSCLRASLLGLVTLAMASACRPTPQGGIGDASASDTPTLAVLLVVDQLTPDLLDAYDPLFTGGFRRLLDEGHRFENATHDHASTETAPGHHTLSTGAHPSRHGVVGNEWAELEDGEWRSVYSVEDLRRTILGYPDLEGRGPANSLRAGLPDWILANDPDSRIVSISRKDRAAIGLAAQAVGHVYWLSEFGGEFVTSDYYRSEYPEWVTEFNRVSMPMLYSETLWETVVPLEARSLSRPDSSRFERDGVDVAFPHRAADVVDAADPRALNQWRYVYTPFPDRAVVSFTIEAVRELELGQRGSTDYLGVSLSQTDLVGHSFGPGSREQLDNLLRLDAELGRLFSFLDDALGSGGWVLALSSDHGVLEIPEILAESGMEASRLTSADRRQLADAIRGAVAGVDEGDRAAQAAKDAVSRLPFVAAAYTFEQIEQGPPVDSFATLYAHSHSRIRVRDGLRGRVGLYVRMLPYVLEASGISATHGSPYYYDRHVPLIFLGETVPSGVSTDRVATVDVAPTLARLVGVPAPADLDGRVLEEILPQ